MAIATLWLFALLLATGLSRLIPPMQSPDEESHLGRAYLISQGQVLLQPLPPQLSAPPEDKPLVAMLERARQHGGRIGGMVDQGLLDFGAAYLTLAAKADRRLTATEHEQLAQMPWTGARGHLAMPGTGYYFPAVYAPQALGLAIGQQLDWTIMQSYQLARTLTLIACFAMLWRAASLLPPAPSVLAILLLPMSVFQLLSPTIDGLTTSLSVLAISLFLRSADSEREHSTASSWVLALSIFLLATTRTHLLPLLALPFYLAWKRRSRRDFYLGCLITAGTLAWLLFAIVSTNDPRNVREHTTLQLLTLYASHPALYLKVVFASLVNHDLFTSYQRSFIGILGWLDTLLPDIFYPTLWTGLGLCALVSVSGALLLGTDWRPRLLLAGLALASIGLIFLALLLTWTPYPATVVQGVQGRYFVVPMVLLGYAFSGGAKVPSSTYRWFAALVVAGFALCALTGLTMTLLSRYH